MTDSGRALLLFAICLATPFALAGLAVLALGLARRRGGVLPGFRAADWDDPEFDGLRLVSRDGEDGPRRETPR